MRPALALLVSILSLTACTPGGGKAASTPAKTPVPEPVKQAAIPQPAQDPVIGTALRELFPHDPATQVFAEVTPRDPKMPAAGFLLDFDGGVDRITALLQAPLDPSLVVLMIPDVGADPDQMLNTWTGVAGLNAALCVMPLQGGIGRDPQAWKVENREARYVESVEDVRRLMNGFEQVEQLKGIPIVLLGEGRGAEVALMATAADTRIDALAMRGMLIFDLALPLGMLPLEIAPFVRPRPVLLQNARQDPTLEMSSFEHFYKQLGEPKTQRWYDGATLPDSAVTDALEWLRATFPPPATAPPT